MNNNENFLNLAIILEKAGIEGDMRVADLGCGSSGFFVFPLSKTVGKKGVVYAVDILRSALDNIEKIRKIENIKNIKTVWSNLEIYNATKIDSGSLDAATLINTLYQTEKRADVLRESIRLLKNRGQLVIVDWKISASPFGPPIKNRTKAEQLKAACLRLGLKLDLEFNAGNYHYGLVFTKM